jgi:DNA-binding NarL/FixJ family response regulator
MKNSVLIVEDDPGFREHFAKAVRNSTDLALAGEANDLPEGLRLLDSTSPNVLLVDIGLPSGSGVELIRHAHQRLPKCNIMVVTVFGDEQHVLKCIEAGASGYLLKDAAAIDIVNQIRALCAGGSPISPLIARQLLKKFQPLDSAHEPQLRLSQQERKVMELSSKGYNYEEIARLLEVSRHTVETYVKRTYRKLQVHNKTEAIYEARKLGLVHD